MIYTALVHGKTPPFEAITIGLAFEMVSPGRLYAGLISPPWVNPELIARIEKLTVPAFISPARGGVLSTLQSSEFEEFYLEGVFVESQEPSDWRTDIILTKKFRERFGSAPNPLGFVLQRDLEDGEWSWEGSDDE